MRARIGTVTRTTAAAGTGIGAAAAVWKATERLRSRALRTKHVMTRRPVTIEPDASVASAAERFAATGVGALPVCEDGGEPVAIVTDRDLVVRVVAQGDDPGSTPVAEIAEPAPVTAHAADPVEAAAARMAAHGLRRLPVVERDRLVGVVTRGDLSRHLRPRAARALHALVARAQSSDRRSGAWLFRRAYS